MNEIKMNETEMNELELNEIESRLPAAFTRRMRVVLGDEYNKFLAGYADPPCHGLRVNRLKTTSEEVQAIVPFVVAPVAWCADGLTLLNDRGARPSGHWAYHAGLYYIQEPSAMSPAAVLNAQPGDRVLDICAAPGGKSAQLAGALMGRGLLVSNDASASRCGALIKNLELAGVTNAVVLNEQPHRLADRFPCFFDRILVDAPCSGEGMFRRDADAVRGWAENKPEACVRAQREILHHASRMLKPGGCMVYSTCTFGKDENEGIIDGFLSSHPGFALLPVEHEHFGFAPGLEPCLGAARIWPHKARGEGHFIALIIKTMDDQAATESNVCDPFGSERRSDARQDRGSAVNRKDRHNDSRPIMKSRKQDAVRTMFTRDMVRVFDAFRNENLANPEKLNGYIEPHGRSLFMLPEPLDLSGLRVMRGGWYLGDVWKDRFAPSQALAMGLTAQDLRYTLNLTVEDAARYLKGESFPVTAVQTDGKPWTLVCVHGFPLGWGRIKEGYIKNYLPRGWATR